MEFLGILKQMGRVNGLNLETDSGAKVLMNMKA